MRNKLGVRGVSIPGIIGSPLQSGSPGVIPLFEFDLGEIVFTPAMAKRTSPGPFETAPIVQGDWDGTGTPDVVTYPRGDQLGNPTKLLYANFDPYQGTAVKWWTAETASADRATGYSYIWYVSADYYARYDYVNGRFEFAAGGVTHTDTQAIVAGTTYFVSFSFDTKNTIDGTNYCRNGVNDTFTYGGTAPTVSAPGATIALGSDGTASPANAIIEGTTFYRRVLFDGTYGKDVGHGDELALIYAAGAGADPCTITSSNDVVTCIPTNSTAGALTTGTGNAWSHPLASSIVDDTFMDQGLIPGGDWALLFNGDTTIVDVTDNATIQDLADNAFTVDIWVRQDGVGENNIGYMIVKGTGVSGEGWRITGFGNTDAVRRVFGYVECATTDAQSTTAQGSFPIDGKSHLITMHYDDAGDRTVRIAIDGIWETSYDSQVAGVGAIISDVGDDLHFGNDSSGSRTWDGAIEWCEISNNDRHGAVAGTDFQNALPSAPYNDGNTVEFWNFDDGTGATVSAGIAGANDGTITDGTWEAIWDRELTPVAPKALEMVKSSTQIDYGSGANIDDLPDNAVAGKGQITAEGWYRFVSTPSDDQRLLHKGGGWRIYTQSGYPRFRVYCAGGNSTAISSFVIADGVWHHIAGTYDETGDRKARLYIDGLLAATGGASVGNYTSDAAASLQNGSTGATGITAAVGWQRVSDNIRYTGTFIPNDLMTPPGNDANAQLLINMDDGTGTTATDTSGNAYNGTITMGSGQWLNTPDMEVIEPGARMYHGGMVIGSDGADDGIVIHTAPTNPSDSVMIPRLSCGQDGQAWMIVDFNGSEFKLPRFQDLHTGANNSATLINANGAFTQQLVGWELYNVTDGSSTTITAVSGDGTTITGVLAGGTDNDWDTNDDYIIRPPSNGNYCDFPIETYGIHVLRTAAAAVDLKVKNEHGAGTMQIHMMEVQESLLANGDHESLDGGFPGAAELITGWTNGGLDAGDTEPEAAIIHSGAQSLEWNTGAASGEYQYYTGAAAVGDFISYFGWLYGDGTTGLRFGGVSTLDYVLQADPSQWRYINPCPGAYWAYTSMVVRDASATPRFTIQGSTGATADRFSDDFGAIALDPITLTCTPASQANSLEGTGIRVDGDDTATQVVPVGYLRANEGHIRFTPAVRHDDSDVRDFGFNGPYWLRVQGDANNYIDVYWSNNDTLTLQFNANGAGAVSANWATGGGAISTGDSPQIDVIYTATWMRLYVDNTLRITVAQPTGFVWPNPTTAYWGSDNSGDNQGDVVIS